MDIDLKKDPNLILDIAPAKVELYSSDLEDFYDCDTDFEDSLSDERIRGDAKRNERSKDFDIDSSQDALSRLHSDLPQSTNRFQPNLDNGFKVKEENGAVEVKFIPTPGQIETIAISMPDAWETEFSKTHVLSELADKIDLPFKCKQCDFASPRSANLKSHIQSKHTDPVDLPFKCSKCNYASIRSSHLEQHISSKHGDKVNLPFKCNRCNYASPTFSHLKSHISSEHSSKCDKCEYTSVKPHNLKRHMLSKHGDNSDLPFKCKQCSYASAIFSDLKSHIYLQHSSKCNKCSYSTVRHCFFKRHVLSKHGDECD